MIDKIRVKKILRGDREAGENLVTENYQRLYRFLRHLTGNSSIAEDLTQSTFVKAWEAMPAFRGECRLSTWLHKIAYFEYTHWLRGRRESFPLIAADHLLDLNADTGFKVVLFTQTLDQLSPELRETFLLYYVQELSMQEVADVLNISIGTIKSRLHTARQRLRELLTESPILEPLLPETLPVLL